MTDSYTYLVGGSTLLYPVSLLIGCWDWVQGGNPLYAAVKCLSVCRGQIWQIFFISFAKSTWHIHFLTSLFFGACTKFISLSKLAVFFGYHHFSKIEGPFPKLRVRAVREPWALLLLTGGAFFQNWGPISKIEGPRGWAAPQCEKKGPSPKKAAN